MPRRLKTKGCYIYCGPGVGKAPAKKRKTTKRKTSNVGAFGFKYVKAPKAKKAKTGAFGFSYV
jgi:hypothetical protein